MVTDDTLLSYIDDILGKLDTSKSELHTKIADVCFRLQGLLRERIRSGTDYKGPKRDRAAYMRHYRARNKGKAI